jgi:hypothetical protein
LFLHSFGGPAQMMNRPWGDPSHSALQILNERFARGEIQKDEYADKRAALLSVDDLGRASGAGRALPWEITAVAPPTRFREADGGTRRTPYIEFTGMARDVSCEVARD